jgi:tetratricopeptide (TPR) repeat protein
VRIPAALLILAGLLALGAPGRAAEDFEKEFAAAVERYEKGNYREAARTFEGLLEAGFTTAAVYYNLGNAHHHLGERAAALRAWEMARRLAPRDPDVRWNIALVEKNLQDKPEGTDGFRPARWLGARIRVFRDGEIAFAFSAAATLLILAVLAAALLPGRRAALRRLALPLLGAFAVAGACVWVRRDERLRPLAFVGDEEVYVRYGPSNDATRAFLLHEGARVALEKESGQWVFVRFGARQAGWVPRDAVLALDTARAAPPDGGASR